MEMLQFAGYEAEFDRDATRNWYVSHPQWGCECVHCRNFLALAGANALPSPIQDFLTELGIPPEKATYVGELYTDEAGIHYQFSYRLAGSLLSVPEQEDTSWGRFCHEPYPYGAPGFPKPHFDLEFYAALPWVLDEKGHG